MASDYLYPFPVLNDSYEQEYSFPRFNSLPWELRNMVWNFALQRRRLIRVSLKRKEPRGPTEEQARAVRYGRPFLHVHGYQLLSQLLRVNSEARRAALAFYRVHLPCMLMRLGYEGTRVELTFGTLAFNPEYDILWFKKTRFLTDFLSVVITHDSRRIGLRNIAITMTDAEDAMHVDDRSVYNSLDFFEAVRNIRELYLVAETTSHQLQAMESRHNQGVFRGGIGVTQHSGPVMSKAQVFRLLNCDPHIRRNLSRLCLGPEGILFEISIWESMIRINWGLDPAKLKFRVLFMFRADNPRFLPPVDNFYDGPEPERLRLPAAQRRLRESSSSPQVPGDQLTLESQVPEREDCVAFGFWLFSPDAFRVMGTPAPDPTNLDWNMLDHWPELGLAYLPTDRSLHGGRGNRSG
ncbi:hypothetical protein F5Y14DRAFT_442060 [Nemania sp. NC0429]|nr:hypothetical protein F5Y14DRAFT_442060 [Nemania sp. NC0429]